jgi:cysteine-rich repeat protein
LGKFTLNLEIKNVAIDPATPSNINVKIKRNPGAGEISGLNFIIEDGDNTEVVKLENLTLNELEERTINLSLKSITNSSKIIKVSVAPIFRLESGKEVTGDVKDDYEMPKTSGTTVATGCLSGSECNDGNGCTTDSCNSGTCSHIAITLCTNNDGCCPSGCTITNDNNCASVCGNGIREGSEGCDDGDTSSGDGCSSLCTVESGYTCNTATPNVCTQTCTPNCVGKNCGSDGCGTNNNCGTCSVGVCNSSGQCVTTWTWTNELVINGGFEWNNLTGWTTSDSSWEIHSGIIQGNVSSINGTYYAYTNGGGNGINGYIYQDMDLTSYASYIDAGNAVINATGWGVSSEISSQDKTRIQILFLNSAKGTIQTYVDTGNLDRQPWWRVGPLNYAIPVNTRYVRMWGNTYEINGNNAGNLDSFSVKLGYRS